MNYSHAEAHAAERGIIDTLVRGLLTDAQAMQLLGVADMAALEAKKERYGRKDSSEAMQEGSIIDGFVNYWESMNGTME